MPVQQPAADRLRIELCRYGDRGQGVLYSGLESFAAPPSLRKIDALAFGECRELRTFELNEDI